MAKSRYNDSAAMLFVGVAIVSRVAILDSLDRVFLAAALVFFGLAVPIKHEIAEFLLMAFGLAFFLAFLTINLLIP